MFLNARYINAINNKPDLVITTVGAVAEENAGEIIEAVDRGKDCRIAQRELTTTMPIKKGGDASSLVAAIHPLSLQNMWIAASTRGLASLHQSWAELETHPLNVNVS